MLKMREMGDEGFTIRILHARLEQEKARRARDRSRERYWTDEVNRLLDEFIEETKKTDGCS